MTARKFDLPSLSTIRSQTKLLLVLIFIVVMDVFILGTNYLQKNNLEKQQKNLDVEKYQELQEIDFTSASYTELENFLRKLAEKKGAEYAYDVLKAAPTKPDIDMHLLGHVIGEVLYKQKGFEGITACTADFRNACSHTIVVGLLMDYGEDALPKIAEACKLAPGGDHAYPLCYHGLGHGVLSSVGYDLPKGVELCKKTGDKLSGPEFTECVGGAIMEIDSGGFHDRDLWLQESKKYLRPEDPLYPCNADFVPSEAKKLCYVYFSPHLLKIAGNLRGVPTDSQVVTAFRYCNELDKNDPNRETCIGAFGKDFVVLAKARDIRNIDKMTDEELKLVNKWCGLTESPIDKHSCDIYALGSLYWGGQYGYGKGVRYCELLEDNSNKNSCFTYLIGLVLFGNSNGIDKSQFCQALPAGFSKQCSNRLASSKSK